MHQDLEPGVDSGSKSWFSEPNFTYNNSSGCTEVGTFRSFNCKRFGYLTNNMCCDCSKIPKLNSFRKRSVLRHRSMSEGKRDITKINNKYLNRSELLVKVDNQKEIMDMKDSQLFFLQSKNLRLKLRAMSLKDKLLEYARRGSSANICRKLNQAAEEGVLEDKVVLKDFLESVANNLHVKKQGKRYKSSLQMFFEIILIWGGPRIANFVALNLFGPEIHSIYRWRKTQTPHLEVGLKENNFSTISNVYKNAHSKVRIPKVPVFFAEDETAIVASIEYTNARDVLQGF